MVGTPAKDQHIATVWAPNSLGAPVGGNFIAGNGPHWSSVGQNGLQYGKINMLCFPPACYVVPKRVKMSKAEQYWPVLDVRVL